MSDPSLPINIRSYGTTTVPADVRTRVPSGVQPGPEPVRRGDGLGRIQRRIFLGPMPEKVVPAALEHTKARKTRKWSLGPHYHREATEVGFSLDQIDDDHAFRFFLSKGGKKEDWTKEADISARKELIRRWKETGWATVRARAKDKDKKKKKGQASMSKWVGSTFEVGGGVLPDNDSHPELPEVEVSASPSIMLPPRIGMDDPEPLVESPKGSDNLDADDETSTSYMTAKDSSYSTAREESSNVDTPNLPNGSTISHTISDISPSPMGASMSRQPLLQPPEELQRIQSTPERLESIPPSQLARVRRGSNVSKSRSEGAASPPAAGLGLRSAFKRQKTVDSTKSPGPDKGKRKALQKTVTFPDHEEEEHPADASSVLLRTGEDLSFTSAGATKQRKLPIPLRDIRMRDRMLVRMAHTRQEVKVYDETHSRAITDLTEHAWREFLVVWRRNRLELYEDHSIPGKEMIVGRKHLAFIISLKPEKTKLMMYSFTDMSFCLTCPPVRFSLHSKAKFQIAHYDEGTDIFVLKHKCRSRGVDWAWNIRQFLDKDVPGSIEVNCPHLHTKVHIDIPRVDANAEEGWKSLTVERVISICRETLSKVRDYHLLIEQPCLQGRELGLAWRREATLDWIWIEKDLDGDAREWAVVYGYILKTPGIASQLELRLAEYRPTDLILSDKSKLYEPPAVEGYIWRIKPNTQARSLMYLASHDGLLFSIPTSNTILPQPPSAPDEDMAKAEEVSSHSEETRRGTAQILASDAVIDIRNIILVRRASQLAVKTPDPQALKAASSQNILEGLSVDFSATESDNEDEGGDDSIAQSANQAHIQMRRSIEFIMRSGHVIRLEVIFKIVLGLYQDRNKFQAYSRKIAVQWVKQFQELIRYWTQRHRIDARLEMELMHTATGSPRFQYVYTVDRDHEHLPELPPDPDDVSAVMGPYWNWSAIKGNRSTLRSGRVYFRKGIRGHYKLMQLVLVSGHLCGFYINPGNRTNAYQKLKTVNLIDAYVCSGQFAMKALSESVEYGDDAPRRYQDGLECNDPEEHSIFIVWHMKHPVDAAILNPRNDGAKTTYGHPNLKSKRSLYVFKARTRLERDAWCWALNAEIEKTSRRHSERELAIREVGGLAKAT